MAPRKKINADQAIKQIGGVSKYSRFAASKLYSNDDVRTVNQWKDQFVEDRIIDGEPKTSEKSTESQE